MSASAALNPQQQQQQRYKLVVFAPLASAPAIKEAVFATGAGIIGNYTNVCFEAPGTGSFLPVEGAEPVVGAVGRVEEVREVRIEIPCFGAGEVRMAIEAVKRCVGFAVVFLLFRPPPPPWLTGRVCVLC